MQPRFCYNKRAQETLAAFVNGGRFPHALLLEGPEGSGRRTFAREIAAALFCRGEHKPCGSCNQCRKVLEQNHPDVEYYGGDGSRRSFHIDTIRQLRQNAWLLPGEAPCRVCVLCGAENMTDQAQNALLKILEEPWDRTLFILVCEHPDRLLPTIVSRTQEVCVPRIAPDVLERVAQQRGVADPLQARNMARLAGGDLLELGHLVAGESDAMRKEHFDLFCSLMRLSYNDRHLELIAWAEDAAQLTREQQRAFLRDAARLLRESFMLHAGIREVSYLWGEELAFCSKFAPFVGPRNIEPLIAEIESAAAQIAQNGNPTIVFTHFALSVSKMIKHL